MLRYRPRRTKFAVFGLLVASLLAMEALSLVTGTLSAPARIVASPFAVLFYLTLVPFDAVGGGLLDLGPVAYELVLVGYYYAVAAAVTRLVAGLTTVLPIRVETTE